MQPRHILYLAVLSVLVVFLIMTGWEFVLEDLFEGSLGSGAEEESLHVRWEFVTTATFAASVAWAVSGPAALRLIAERRRAEQELRAANETLDRRVKERTAELEREIGERERAEEALRESEQALRTQVVELEEAQRKLERQGGDLVLLAEDLRVARDQAEAANRTKSEFLANMSHELRTPLNAILGFSDVIGTEIFGPIGTSKYREYIEDIRQAGQHLLDLVNDILDLSKVEAGADTLHEEDMDIAEVVTAVVTLVKERAQSGSIKLEVDVPVDLPALRADKRKIKQILLNLLSNGIKFTPAGGKVTLSCWCRPESGCVFQIIDTGIGIALEDIPKALTPFQQIDGTLGRRYDGTGLGLPLSKFLVEQHGGSLDLQSQVDSGTTVTVRFPAERILVAGAEVACVDEEEREAI